MKNRRSAIAMIASAASLALVLSVSAPASAADVSGVINCGSSSQAKVTITTSQAGRITWERPGYPSRPVDSWIGTSYVRTFSYYARNLGTARWTIDSKFQVTATCVRL